MSQEEKTELKAKRLLPIPIPMPPLLIQRRIVAKLGETCWHDPTRLPAGRRGRRLRPPVDTGRQPLGPHPDGGGQDAGHGHDLQGCNDPLERPGAGPG